MKKKFSQLDVKSTKGIVQNSVRPIVDHFDIAIDGYTDQSHSSSAMSCDTTYGQLKSEFEFLLSPLETC